MCRIPMKTYVFLSRLVIILRLDLQSLSLCVRDFATVEENVCLANPLITIDLNVTTLLSLCILSFPHRFHLLCCFAVVHRHH